MQEADHYDDYLRTACGLPLYDGPPPTLTVDQARAALLALATDIERYHTLLARAIRNAKQPTPAALVAALHQFTSQP